MKSNKILLVLPLFFAIYGAAFATIPPFNLVSSQTSTSTLGTSSSTSLSKVGAVCTDITRTLVLFSADTKKNRDVSALQTYLRSIGLYTGKISGSYNLETEKAVKVFQKQNNITSSGMVMKQTRGAIKNKTCTTKTAENLLPPVFDLEKGRPLPGATTSLTYHQDIQLDEPLPPAGFLVPTKESIPKGYSRNKKTGGTFLVATGTVGYDWEYERLDYVNGEYNKNTITFSQFHYAENNAANQEAIRKTIELNVEKGNWKGRYFMYNNSKGYLKNSIGNNFETFELYWDDRGTFLQIKLNVPVNKFTDQQVVNILRTMRYTDGKGLIDTEVGDSQPTFYGTSTIEVERKLKMASSLKNEYTMKQVHVPDGLLGPTSKSLPAMSPYVGESISGSEDYFYNISPKEKGYRITFMGILIPEDPQGSTSYFSYVRFSETLATSTESSYEARSQNDLKEIKRLASIDGATVKDIQVKKFTYQGREGVLYSYKDMYQVYNLHYNDNGNDLQIIINNPPKNVYTEEKVIDILSTLVRAPSDLIYDSPEISVVVPPKGLLGISQKSLLKGFSLTPESKAMSDKNSTLTKWYSVSYGFEDVDRRDNRSFPARQGPRIAQIVFSEHEVAPYLDGNDTQGLTMSYQYIVSAFLDNIAQGYGSARFFTYNGRQGFLWYSTTSPDVENVQYSMVWDDSGKVFQINVSAPFSMYTQQDVINILTTLRRSDGKKLDEVGLSSAKPVFFGKEIKIDQDLSRLRAIELKWPILPSVIPDVGRKGLLIPTNSTVRFATSSYLYVYLNNKENSSNFHQYYFYMNEDAPYWLYVRESDQKSYQSITSAKNNLALAGNSGSWFNLKKFTYQGNEGVLYTHKRQGRVTYDLHYNDEGRDLTINLSEIPEDDAPSKDTVIGLLKTLKRSDGHFAEMIANASSSDRGEIVLRLGHVQNMDDVAKKVQKGLLIPTQSSICKHCVSTSFGSSQDPDGGGSYEGVFVPLTPNWSKDAFSVTFKEDKSNYKKGTYASLSKEDYQNILKTTKEVSQKTFTHNGSEGVIYSYGDGDTRNFSLHYNDGGDDLQIVIKNAPKDMYSEDSVIALLKTFKRKT